MKTVQLLGSTTLSRVALPWFMENGGGLGARVVALDPGDEDEARPWFAPVRGLCRELGVQIGRRDADITLDLDPAHPDRPKQTSSELAHDGPKQSSSGVAYVRLGGAAGVTPDLCRALLPGRAGLAGEWAMISGDGVSEWARVALAVLPGDDGATLLARASLRGVEALAAGWAHALLSDDERSASRSSLPPWPTLAPGRFRHSEAQLVWQGPPQELLARIRALSGPWGGARCHLGDTPIAIESAELADVKDLSTGGEPVDLRDYVPGTIIAIDAGVVVACGAGAAPQGRPGSAGALRLLSVRPSWRPMRRAAEYAIEVGAGPGYQLC